LHRGRKGKKRRTEELTGGDSRSEREEERERGRARAEERGGVGPGCWVGLPSLLSSSFLFFFSILKLFKQNYLNSNKFEFKPYKLNTRKTMLQHECTNMLIL
jgi:hypothetical protein